MSLKKMTSASALLEDGIEYGIVGNIALQETSTSILPDWARKQKNNTVIALNPCLKSEEVIVIKGNLRVSF